MSGVPPLDRITLCALTYGHHRDLCARLLQSLYTHTDPARFLLRLGLNAPSEDTRALARQYAEQHANVSLIDSPTNLFKSPMMRRLFHEPRITTEWTAWFDDDSHVLRSDWLQRLALKIEAHPECAAWGRRYLLDPDHEVQRFVRTASWYRGRPWQLRHNEHGQLVPSFTFPVGGFWAVRTQVIYALDWPDPRLHQAGDDFIFGEALRQHGLETGTFDRGIAINAAPRRNAAAPEVTFVPVV